MNSINLLLLAQAAAPSPAAPQQSPFSMLVPMILMIAIFYFLLIRPQQKRQKEHQKLVESLKSGDKVITNAGIHGIIANVKEKTIIVKVADNVKIEFDRAAVTAVEKAAEGADETK